MRKPSPSMIVALVALFVALSGVGVAATGGNLILGRTNNASLNTQLSSAVAGGKALSVTNSSSAAGSTALSLSVGSGHAPFAVNSSVKVANLNADRLDGYDATTLQQRVTGSCQAKSAMTGITVTGSVVCSPASQAHVVAAQQLAGAFPKSGSAFQFVTQGGFQVVTFDVSGYSSTPSHLLGGILYICAQTPCGGSQFVEAITTFVYANEADSHRALVARQSVLNLPAGTWYANIAPYSDTSMDAHDWASVSILEL